jgi:hypothetical protein
LLLVLHSSLVCCQLAAQCHDGGGGLGFGGEEGPDEEEKVGAELRDGFEKINEVLTSGSEGARDSRRPFADRQLSPCRGPGTSPDALSRRDRRRGSLPRRAE